MRKFIPLIAGALLPLAAGVAGAQAQPAPCDIPAEARDIWRCRDGFVIGPENVIIRLPIPETDPEALYNAGLEAARREDWRVAIAYFTAAHQRAHLVPTYMYNLGLAHARAGNEVAAIGWLAAYLVAEPEAPNRSEVWAQIATLEAAAGRRIDLLWRQAEAAVAAMPTLSGLPPRRIGEPEPFGRAEAMAHLQQARASTAPGPGRPRQERWSPLQFASRPDNDERLIDAGRRSGRAGMVEAAGSFTRNTGLDRRSGTILRDAALGEASLVREGVAAWRSENPNFPPRPEFFADLAEIYLLAGDIENATWALRVAREAGVPSVHPGNYQWRNERIAALLLAEQGRVAEAVSHLQVFASRDYVTQRYRDFSEPSRVTPFAPGPRWNQERLEAIASVAQYLWWRGRRTEALELARQLDTLRSSRIGLKIFRSYQYSPDLADNPLPAFEAEALRIANQGRSYPDPHRERVEGQVLAARALSDAAYDLNWWLSWLANAAVQTEREGPTQGALRFILLTNTAQALALDLQQICWDYEWGSGPRAASRPSLIWGGADDQPPRCYRDR